MKTYDNYIHSENDLIGLIPSHWKLNQIKRTLHLLTDYDANGSFSDINQNVKRVDDIKDKYAWFVRTTDLEKYKPNFDLNEFIWVDEPTYNYLKKSKLFGGELLLAKRGDIGRVYLMPYTKYPASLAPNLYLARLDEKHIIPSYAYYFLLSEKGNVQLNLRNKSTTLGALYKDDFKSIEFLYPPLPEQTAIAQYLDAKTQAIDKKINLLTKKAETYKELRKSIINDVVCKGLDKNVKLKESGIDWIGQIPEHWEVKRLKALGEIETSSVNKKIEEDEELVKLVNYTDVYGNMTKEIWNSESYMVVSANKLQLRYKKLRQGDVLFTPSSETIEDIGVSAVVMEDLKNTLYSYHILRLKFAIKMQLNFKKYLFNNDFVQEYFSKSATGTTRKILGLNTFYNLPVVFPPTKEEQTTIANYLDEKTQKIDAIVINIGKQIDTLKELRKTLINDVVTGKIMVNG